MLLSSSWGTFLDEAVILSYLGVGGFAVREHGLSKGLYNAIVMLVFVGRPQIAVVETSLPGGLVAQLATCLGGIFGAQIHSGQRAKCPARRDLLDRTFIQILKL